ncbi:Imm59 family immunity protein [Listeria costaricensis]|uniref:Imm59 family immunity protein n=1 Tax=Listeria costaricensis TaxID=2026604 RepID=UPI000C06EB62|nr:Imm59 family immunity protein [Listeria costaricensis]
MNHNLAEYKQILEEDIQLLGFEELRYSIFEGEENNREEYQVRIEKKQDIFEVYVTGERASVMGKHKFTSVFEAMDKFLNIMQSRILSNRRKVKNGEPPEYPCPLWDN